MLRITNFRVPLTDDTPLARLAAKRLKIPPRAVLEVVIVRKALDARRKNNINFVYSLDVTADGPEGQILSRLAGDRDIAVAVRPVGESVEPGPAKLDWRPVVVGFGPAGMFAALTLTGYGYRPLVLERGRDVDRRVGDVTRFWQTGQLDLISNVQFGEGGAGAFSDGKLTTRVQDPRIAEVLATLVDAGAPPEIKYLHKPHIGTDRLREVVKNIRRQIIAGGGEIEFEAQVTDIIVKDGRLSGVIINGVRQLPCSVALFALGHSARDTYAMLERRGVAMAGKAFAVGVRIEHPQEMIDRAQYGRWAGHSKLGAADYALVYHAKDSGRTAYSFCMCPGGLVVAAASETGGVVTNGMSMYNRDSGVANSALVVNVGPADFGGRPLDGVEFQRHYEQLAFAAGGSTYQAPAQTVASFLTGRAGRRGCPVPPSYKPGVVFTDLRTCLPPFVATTLAGALPEFERKITGFANSGAVMTGIETRTSAPLRLLRGDDYQSLNTGGFYPVGEGAGYAGGIISAALDGLNASLTIIKKYRND